MLEPHAARRLAGLRGMMRIAALVLAASTTTVGAEPASVLDRERAVLEIPAAVVEAPGDVVPDDAGRAILGPRCCPNWSRYVIVDALFLQRDNSLINRPLVLDNGTTDPDAAGAVLLTTRDLQYATAPGTRIFFGEYGPENLGWEIGYLGVYGMYADAGVIGPDTLQVPGDLGQLVGSGFDDAVQIRPTTVSSLNMAEANVFTYCCCRTGGKCAKLPWDRCHCACTCSNWLLGLRWAGLDETANLDITCCEGDPAVPYRVTTSTQMIGPQVGYRRRKEWACWAYEGWAKVGLMGTVLTQSQGAVYEPFVALDPVLVREPQSSSRGGVGMIGDMNFTVIRRLNETWGLRLGYNLIWLTGAALAANQWDFTDTPTSGTALVGGGSLLLHGANLGLEARW
jgi:hypothetical protein